MTKITPATLSAMKRRRERIAVLTAYDAPTARLLDEEGVDVVLVGDSVGNVKLGHGGTRPVTLDDMIHHTRAARRGNVRALLVADMPFRTYEKSPSLAARNARRLVKEGGAAAVKVEGASAAVLKSVRAIRAAGIPVMGHVGLTPQSVADPKGYRVQGRDAASAAAVREGALALEKAGVFSIVLEAIPGDLGRAVTGALKIPTIGIGAGPACDGQVLVVDDLLGLTPAPRPKFVRGYADLRGASLKAVRAWRADVKAGRFPGPAETY